MAAPILSSPPSFASPVSAAEVAGVRRPTTEAHMLPPRVFHDPIVLAYEREAWFADEWVCVGREEDFPQAGSYHLVRVAGQRLVVIRGRDGQIRAFHNLCRHRGATLLTEPCGTLVRFQCPYHAWIYDLEGRLRQPRHTDTLIDFDLAENGLIPVALDSWQGFIFLNLRGEAPPLLTYLADMPAFFARYDLAGLRRARQIDYDVRANWKIIIENYSECYHCPGVHPQLNQITPYNLGEWIPSTGPWSGSWMEVVGDYETLSTDGATHGRAFVPGTSAEDHKRVYYFELWPNMLISLHPDYLMVHRVWPVEPGRTAITCEWLFAQEAIAQPGFDPSDAVDFWDLTNRQDWEVCELQQEGTGSAAYTPGRYSAIESGVHAFDLMVADRYANDGAVSHFERTLKKPGTARASSQAAARR